MTTGRSAALHGSWSFALHAFCLGNGPRRLCSKRHAGTSKAPMCVPPRTSSPSEYTDLQYNMHACVIFMPFVCTCTCRITHAVAARARFPICSVGRVCELHQKRNSIPGTGARSSSVETREGAAARLFAAKKSAFQRERGGS